MMAECRDRIASIGVSVMSRNVQYVTDANGERTAVILPLEEYEELLEDLHVSRVAYETKDEPSRPLSEVVEEMRNAGEIDV
jgi:PHD/YefM family antitoxin component YafN of YafNO toxin-antitoxin module